MKPKFYPLVLILALAFKYNVSAQTSPNVNTGVKPQVTNINLYPLWSKCVQTQLNIAYDFDVTLLNNVELSVKSKIYVDTAKRECYMLYTNKELKKDDPNRVQKLYPEQTTKVSRTLVTNQGFLTLKGYPAYGCWLFKLVAGRISAFSPLSEIDNVGSATIVAFEPEYDSLKRLDSLTLAGVVQDNPAALKAVSKKEFYKAITIFNE